MDPQNTGGERQGSGHPGTSDPRRKGTAGADPNDEARRQQERDRQNDDDPSRAPESGDRE